ncbi:MAG: hydroxymethylbilane synthase [Chloroflexota bacterium]
MDNQHIVVGSRRSDLALWQSNHVIDLLKQAHHGLTAEIKIISTKGDQIIDKPLPSIGGKGLFTEALEDALRDGDIDIAVHSLKDLPTEDATGLTVGAVPTRADVRDVLVSRGNHVLGTLPEGASVGTSSRRRAAQLLAHRPDLNIIDIRGNVPTRVEKALDPDGPYDAIVLAKAGLERLELAHHISEVLPLEIMLPAPGQGALGVQCRDDEQVKTFVAPIIHAETLHAVIAERRFLNRLEAGCSAPVAALATASSDAKTLKMTGRVSMPDGTQLIEVVDNALVAEASEMGERMAELALERGAEGILETVK